MGHTSLRELVAADVMQRDMVTVSPVDTLRDALALMTENHVTGLPVMDDKSRCIGLITASDILGFEEEHADDSAEKGDMMQHFNADSGRWESVPVSAFGLEEFGDVHVEEVMSRDLIWVDRDTSIKKIASQMINDDVHRVLVMDERFNLYGIITSFDFVRVVAET
jgi:CBS domain-containing protein